MSVTPPRSSPPRLDAASCTLGDVSMSSREMSRILNDLDQSVDSDAMSLRGASVSGSFSNLHFLSNRDSVYELQMDAQLETSRALLRNSFHSDDDAWSLGSFPRDDVKTREVVAGRVTCTPSLTSSTLRSTTSTRECALFNS